MDIWEVLLMRFSFEWIVGEIDATEKLVAPIKVYSEKELIKEMERIASTLVPEKDWSLRIAAMQRVEGLVFGGLTVIILIVHAIICIFRIFRVRAVKPLYNLINKEGAFNVYDTSFLQ